MIDYSSLISDKARTIKPSGIRKFFDIVSTMEDAISLGVGEPDFQTPWQVRRAGIDSLQQGKTFYTSKTFSILTYLMILESSPMTSDFISIVRLIDYPV